MTDYLTPRDNPYLPQLPDVNQIAALLQQQTAKPAGALYAQASAPASGSDQGSSTLALLSALQGSKGSKSQGRSSGRNPGIRGHGGPGGQKSPKSIGAKKLPDSVNNSVSENRKIAKAVMAKKYPQWTHADYVALVKLWNRESGWNAKAENPTSTASGIPQMMLSVHNVPGNYQHSPLAQILTGEKYIHGRYNDPEGAWRHSQATGWY